MGTFLDKPKLSEPNEMGFQFGIDEELTNYAHREVVQTATKSLPAVKITVLQVWKDDKLVSRLLVDEKTNKPIEERADFEAAAVAIDKYRLILSFSDEK